MTNNYHQLTQAEIAAQAYDWLQTDCLVKRNSTKYVKDFLLENGCDVIREQFADGERPDIYCGYVNMPNGDRIVFHWVGKLGGPDLVVFAEYAE